MPAKIFHDVIINVDFFEEGNFWNVTIQASITPDGELEIQNDYSTTKERKSHAISEARLIARTILDVHQAESVLLLVEGTENKHYTKQGLGTKGSFDPRKKGI